MSDRLRAWSPAVGWALLIFLLSARPTLPVGLGGGLDKLAHFGAYAVLGLFLAHAVADARLALVLGWIYGVADEIHQSFVPGRAAESGDLLADGLGVLAGVALYHLLRRPRERDSSPRAGRFADSPPT